MKKYIREIIIVITIFFLLFTLTSCSQKSKKSNPETGKKINIIKPKVADLNKDIVEIISQIDLIPYYKKQITEKKKFSQGKEGKKQKNEAGSGKADKKSENSNQDSQSKFTPKPLTIKESLLIEILEKEIPYEIKEIKKKKIPEDIVFIWYEINNKIKGLHEKWEGIKITLEEKKIFKEPIEGFEKSLNKLTTLSSNHNYQGSLIIANKLTSYLPQFKQDAKEKTFSAIMDIKFNLRQIILDIANNKEQEINKRLDKIKSDLDLAITNLKKNKATETIKKLKSSISSLEGAISAKDLIVIKTKTAIVMKNIITAENKIK